MTLRFFRWLLALHQIWFYARFLPEASDWFGPQGMAPERLRTPWFPSLIDYLPQGPEWVTSALALLLLLWLMFALNFLPRWGQYFLFLLNISFHHANPYIIHEPQQMANLMLLLQIFVFPEDAKRNVDPRLTRLLQLWLGVYYLLAGLKKIPMEIWQDGTAVAALIQWSPFLKEGWLTDLILSQADWLSPFLTWTVLGWEILFLPLTLSRYRAVALWLGIFVHTGIWFCMEVGSFSFMMMVWYSLCFPLRDFLFRAPMKR